jgi:hypothetical protein
MEQTTKFYEIKQNQPAHFLKAYYKRIYGAALLVLPFFILTSILSWFIFGRYGYYSSELSLQIIYSLPAYLLNFFAFAIYFTLLNGMLAIINSDSKITFSYSAAFSLCRKNMRYIWLPLFSVFIIWILLGYISIFLATAIVVLFIPLAFIAVYHRIRLPQAFERMKSYARHPDFKKQLPSLVTAGLISLVGYIGLSWFFRLFYFLSHWYVSVIIINVLIWFVKLCALGFWYAYAAHFYALHSGPESVFSEKTSGSFSDKNRRRNINSEAPDADEDFIPIRSDKKEKPKRKMDKSDPDYNRFEHWEDGEVKF